MPANPTGSASAVRTVPCDNVLNAIPMAMRPPLRIAMAADSTSTGVLERMLSAISVAGRPSSKVDAVRADALPFHSWSFDAHLLVQSGRRISPITPGLWIESPPCMWGARCVGMDRQMALQGFPAGFPGVVFMCMLTLKELREHMSSGQLPAAAELKRPCLMCWWRLVTTLEINTLCEDRFKLPQGVVVSPYYNAVRPGEYLPDVCIQPCLRNGLQKPIAAFMHDRLHAVRDAHGIWYVDHSAMRWTPAPGGTPGPAGTGTAVNPVGIKESGSFFSRRAS